MDPDYKKIINGALPDENFFKAGKDKFIKYLTDNKKDRGNWKELLGHFDNYEMFIESRELCNSNFLKLVLGFSSYDFNEKHEFLTKGYENSIFSLFKKSNCENEKDYDLNRLNIALEYTMSVINLDNTMLHYIAMIDNIIENLLKKKYDLKELNISYEQIHSIIDKQIRHDPDWQYNIDFILNLISNFDPYVARFKPIAINFLKSRNKPEGHIIESSFEIISKLFPGDIEIKDEYKKAFDSNDLDTRRFAAIELFINYGGKIKDIINNCVFDEIDNATIEYIQAKDVYDRIYDKLKADKDKNIDIDIDSVKQLRSIIEKKYQSLSDKEKNNNSKQHKKVINDLKNIGGTIE